MELFAALPDICRLPLQVSVQTVVTRDTVEALEEKVLNSSDSRKDARLIA